MQRECFGQKIRIPVLCMKRAAASMQVMVSVYVDEHDAANKVCPAEHLFRVSEDTQLAGVVWCAFDYICRPTFTSRQMSLVSTFFLQGLLRVCSCTLQVTPLDNLKTQVIVPNLDCAQNPRQIEWRIYFLFSWILDSLDLC